MCGLVAIISKQKNGIFNGDAKVFTEMLFADQLRGSDGTGIMYNQKEKMRVLKGAIASSDFVNGEMYDKAIAEIIKDGNFVVGHNRSATKGKLSNANTHPFRQDHITLVHNGTLYSHQHLADTEVDSHAICVSMAKIGYKETLKKINGAFALIWTDSRNKTINFIRNNQRPLWIVETPYLFILVSEKELAHWILARNNQTVTSTTEVPVGVLHQFEFGKYDKYYTEKIDFYTPPPFVNHTPYKPQLSLIELDNSKTVVETSPEVGEKIRFLPVEIDKENSTKLIGEWEDKVTGECLEVRFWASDSKHALNLLDGNPLLEGYISHIAYPKDGGQFLIMRNVYKVKATTEHKTRNGVILADKDIDKIESACECCGVSFSKAYIKENISKINATIKQDGKLEYTCPDCSMWLNQWDDSYQGVN